MIVDIIRPRGWSPAGTHTGGCHERQHEATWRDCPTCWAAGRIYEQRPGNIWYAETCPTCLGVGQVVR